MKYSSPYKSGQNRLTFSTSTGAPTGGLNSRDPQATRGPAFADRLDNWVASPNGCDVRKGYRKHASGIPGFVKTLIPYNTVVGQNRFFAAYDDTAVYGIADVTNPGVADTTSGASQSGLSSSQWSYINFTTPAGHYLVICNGVDPARHWDGSQWVVWTRSNTPTIGQIGGIEPSKFASVIAHQKRLWFVEANSSRAWYLPVESVGGGAVMFDFGSQFPRGGRLVSLASWSMNGGQGMQNLLVAISSNGDVVIYQGLDPSDPDGWSIQGTWRLGSPVGTSCFLPFGGDTLLLSKDGLVPLSKFMQTTTTTPALTDTIRTTITDILNSQGDLSDGFQLHDYFSENILILNVPQINPLQNIQFVYNTITGGWSTFSGWPAQCFGNFGEEIFFGGFQGVYRCFVGYKDNANFDGTGGDSYVATALQSASNFEKPGLRKQFSRAKVNLQSAVQAPDIRMGCNVDFDKTPPDNTGAVLSPGSSAWNFGHWDSSTWGSGSLSTFNEWSTLGDIGYYGAIVLSVSVQAETSWISTDWEIQPCNN